MELISLQEIFQHSILDYDESAIELIAECGNVSSSDRLKIYQEAYRLRLTEVLADNFKGLNILLGDDEFKKLSLTYINHHPSSFTSARWFGDQLYSFLRETRPYSDQPMLAEMAEFEWKLLLAFDGLEEESVAEEMMQLFTPDQWPELVFEFHPTVQRINLQWNIVQFRNQVNNEEPNISAPNRLEYPIGWILWRSDLKQKYRSMDVDEAWAVDTLMKGGSFADICEGLCEWVDAENAAGRAASFLKSWLKDGMIIDVGVPIPDDSEGQVI